MTSEGWANVRETFFSPADFADSFPAVLDGFWLDVKLFVIVEIAVLVLGLGLALNIELKLAPVNSGAAPHSK